MLDSGVQLRAGPNKGGVAGWLDRDGRPEFVYLEITGYYLTTMAWLASGAASSEQRRELALERGRHAVEWMRSVTAAGAVPLTRLYLTPGTDDWRNAAIFTFDLAMAARGVACFTGDTPLLGDLGARLEEIRSDTALLASHALRNGAGDSLPDRWSTRPGPHHIKAAGALMRLPIKVLDETSRNTVAHWDAALREAWPCDELHPLLYGLEGLLLAEASLDSVEEIYRRLLRLQGPDGALPAMVDGSGGVRSDVLAQALRIGALLRGADRLPGDDWTRRLDGLAAALLRHVRPDGDVLFSTDQDVANAWCAMFTHQALLLHARASADRRADSLI